MTQDPLSSRFSSDRLPGWLRRLGWGELCSLLLHATALWWLIAGPDLTPPPPPPHLAVAVALVGDGGTGRGHAAQTAAGSGAAATPAPAVKAAPAPPPLPQPAPRPAASKPHAVVPAPHPDKTALRPRHKAPPPKPPADDFYSRLKAAERRQTAPAWREAQDGSGQGAAAGGAHGGGGRGHGGGSDIMRAYIARHWNFDLSLLRGRDVEITLYLVVDKLGNVLEARGVALGAGPRDRAAAEIAASARRAAQVASPLPLPPGQYGDRNALVVHLSTRDVVR